MTSPRLRVARRSRCPNCYHASRPSPEVDSFVARSSAVLCKYSEWRSGHSGRRRAAVVAFRHIWDGCMRRALLEDCQLCWDSSLTVVARRRRIDRNVTRNSPPTLSAVLPVDICKYYVGQFFITRKNFIKKFRVIKSPVFLPRDALFA